MAYRFADIFGPPPTNRAERRRARREVGISDISGKDWTATIDGKTLSGTSCIITIGETTINARAADQIAARRTAEGN